MKSFAKILVATDFSPTCVRALEHAAALAARSGAELHVLNVQVLRGDLYNWQPRIDITGIEKAIEGAAHEEMQKFVAGQHGVVVSKVMRDVQAAPAIMRYAREMDIDLIVMGTHARNGVSRLFLGSVAAEVLRVADLPVLVIRPDHPVADGGYRKVVVAVDLSEDSAALLQQATALVDTDNAQLRVVHVSESRSSAPYFGTETADEQRKKADLALKELLNNTSFSDKVESRVLVGRPEEQITATAKDFDADLIVMGSTGTSRIGGMLLGSTTDRVVRQAPCAVLAWRSEREREARLEQTG